MNHLLVGDNADFARNALLRLCRALPSIPSVLRYHDEFTDSVHSIRNLETLDTFDFFVNGAPRTLDFSKMTQECSLIFKHVLAYLLTQDLATATIYSSLFYAYQLHSKDVAAVVEAGPTGIGIVWKELRGKDLQVKAYVAAKYLLQLLCVYRLNGWSNDHRHFLTTTLPLPFVDKYAAVRSGDAFLSADEEALIVRYFDFTVAMLENEDNVSIADLTDTGMLLCSYQFAMRPIQIGMLDVRHVRIWNDDLSGMATVHLTFHMAKQRANKSRVALTRRVKQEWAPIFIRLHALLLKNGIDGDAKFFQTKSSSEVGIRISSLARRLLGTDDIGSATDLRHTAAQRLVDAGANHEELAEFMGHAQTDTGLVYYATSASHAERVNKALGASEIYRRVAKIAHDRFISPEELAKLKDEQQVAAVPHGIPIAGIGGCQSGQPACPYNPITSCYGCHKFMPVSDKALHAKVLTDMREIVLFFEGSSRSDVKSPAYMQLQRTIAEIQSVIDEFEEGNG
ncbi:site-specific integrase [Undibacterium rugosum]|uniref:site-specific integrase n=1 Tax=Undibacterium rugosum TaxID=2762291 RepID=UPI001B820190|nr:site-specific integrase [Undibacterium rugosum]MBR7780248.1 site-specific integrase [Undibacterium rugosum]